MRLVPVVLLVAVVACSDGAPPSTTVSDLRRSGESFASAVLRGATRKPCLGDCRVVPRAALLAAGGTYAEALVGRDSVLRRWPVRVGEPVRVWVDGNGLTKTTRARREVRVRRSLTLWETSGVPVRFSIVKDSAEAEVRVLWASRLPGRRAGFIRWMADSQGWLIGADIVLAMRDGDGAFMPPGVLDAVAIHEIGHLLGLEHSDAGSDIMAARVETGRPSDRDIATLRFLYGQSAGRVR